jgi:hypothetical protein
MRRLSRKGLSAYFAIELTKQASPQQRKKSLEVGELFDEMKAEYGLESRALFHAAADELHARFLKDVRSCPTFVIAFCQHHLAPDALVEHHSQKEKERLKSVARLKKELEKIGKAAS